MRIRIATVTVASVAISLVASRAAAQGSFSQQGFGYPTGQLSSYSLGMGGSLAEFDPLSPVNPSSLAVWGRAGLYVQYDPEFRRVSSGGRTDRTTTSRFPVVATGVPIGQRATLGISSSTFLDRTWSTSSDAGGRIGDDSVVFTDRFKVIGAINDVRLGFSWTFSPRFVVGVGGHVLVGENRISVSREFPDSLGFGSLLENFNIAYTGLAASAGVQFRPSRALGVAASGRLGGTLRARSSDTLVSRASVPDRFGVALRYDGFTGATIAVRADRTLWTQMDALGSDRVRTRDGWDFGLGGDFAGPRFLDTQMSLRAGARRRTLPFSPGSEDVTENAFVLGVGLPLAASRAGVDLALQRATRSGGGGAREHAWTISVGLSVRP